ncbi:MAG TPA: VanZ family protein [Burkholderiaceae bacterium]|jgi:VanZ family protein
MTTHHHHRPIQASTFARVGLVMYLLLIIYASWYPFVGWHSNGLSPFAYLFAPLPHYWTVFDVVTNIIGYAPFGIFVVFALYPAVRGVYAVALAAVCSVLLSGTMEAVQTFLPTRVSSNLDFLTNIGGAIAGAIIAAMLTPKLLERSRFLQYRRRWFLREAGRGFVVIGLWPLAQIYPQGYLFGHGQLIPILSSWLSDWYATSIDLGAILRQGVELSPEQYWLSEAIMTACGLTGALLTLLCLLRKNAPTALLATLLMISALAVKAMASALFFAPENAFAWLTPGAQGGLLFGTAMVFGLAFAPPVAQRRIAAVMLVISLLVVNIVPANPYFVVTLQTWVQGKFLNFNGAAQFLSLFWPFFALWFLLHSVHRQKEN